MNAKKTTERTSNILYAATIIAIVVVVNILGSRFFGRVDLTENKLYSISPTTEEILGGLDDVVSVKAYFSKKLPVQLSRLPKEIDDMLEEYRIYSHGNVHYERIDPADDEELKRKLAGHGVMPVTMTIIEKDERQQINGYLGITVSYGENTEAIPMVQNTNDLEYDLTSRIFRVTTEPRHVGFLTSYSRHDLMGDYQAFTQEVRKIHEIDPVDLSDEESEIPEEIGTLIFAGPTDSVPPSVQLKIDQFVMRGGRAIFLIDNLLIDERRQPQVVNHGMKEMMAGYGLRMGGDVVKDDKSHNAEQVRRGIFTMNQPNPFFPRVTGDGFGEHPVVSRLSELTLPWTGSLEEPQKSAEDSLVAFSVLARTSDAAQSMKPPTFQPSPQTTMPLALLVTGKITSAFKRRPDLLSPNRETSIFESEKETSVILVPCSSFLQARYLYPGNLEFMLNAVDFLTIGDKLISIRTRPTTDRPLEEISPEMKNFMRILNIVGIPILVIIFGAMRFYLKRRDKIVRARSL